MKEVIFEINDKPISVNKMRKGKTYLTDEYKYFKQRASLKLKEQAWKKGHQTDLRKDLVVEVTFYLTTANQSDIDGVVKCTLDACTEAGIWKDDRYIKTLILHKEKALVDKVIIKIH